MVYAYEHGTGSAVWATDPTADSLDGAAVAWAVQRAGGSFDGTRDLSGFAYRGGQTPTAAAPVVTAAPPEVVVVHDSIDGDTRHVTLRVRSRIGAEYMAFMYDARGSTRLLTINGKALTDPADLVRVEHWGEPDGAIVLELEMPDDEAIGLHVIEHLLRPEELLGADAFARPPELAPDITRLSDRAMFRYSVGAFVDPRHAIVRPGGQGPTTTPSPEIGGESRATPTDTIDARPDTISPDSAISSPDPVQPDTGTARPDTTGVDRLGVVGRNHGTG